VTSFWRSALGVLLGLFARVYLATLRVSVQADAALDPTDRRPWLLCFWHGDQLPLLRWKRRRTTAALVSHSRDGQMQARALALQGLAIERGSSSRGGARGLFAIVRRLRRGEDAAFAIDGPRGPRHVAAAGARTAARLSSGVLVPMGSACARALTLEKAWDKFRIPLPFTRVTVRLGAPIEPSLSLRELEYAVHRASSLAATDLGLADISFHMKAGRREDFQSHLGPR
jgi:lysophospholipid acyltransferase (LPLAT)-like uncharacterized protein